ncbi:DUF3558 family protein [Actinacidiphila sp. ITFR-21]|uniref:DUF3558 family protein n=1 Tax=Actinacidiphila sp. ITFR-21 TaxID=3075199 RepID=UPI00288AA7DF|nr:DUF3558 family protein [Streptomyces sp. ITFR-21]WNI18021.1 DUF3558 family protein [Streptomyces sp. ITFR-21]
MKRTSLTALLTVSLALAASACDSSPSSPAAGDHASGGRPATAASASASTSASASAPGDAGKSATVDACTLLKPAEVTPVIGRNDGGQPESGVGESVCGWENPDTYYSITVSVGGHGTAVSGGIKDEPGITSEPGPDGIRYFSGGVARFAAGDRDCEVQVVSGAGGDSDRSTATKLVGLLRGRI